MTIGSRRASLLLFLGDVIVFAFSLWLTLLIRYRAIPSHAVLALHEGPFSLLFIVWLGVFFMSGLYDKRAIFFTRDLSGRIVRTQVVNIVLAALFFFLIPAFGITPKTNLVIYLIVSLVLIILWRIVIFPRVAERRTRTGAVIVGVGSDEEELKSELNSNTRYAIHCSDSIDPTHTTPEAFSTYLDSAERNGLRILIVDTRDPAVAPLVPEMYKRAFEEGSYQIVDFLKLYEEVFDRVPLSVIGYEWFFRYVSRNVSGFYLFAKRVIDIVGGLLMGIVMLVALPFVWFALALEGPGPVFIEQMRLGEREMRIRTYKFRTMRMNKRTSSEWTSEEARENPVTKVGAFLRRTSLDEFPQCVNVLKGELSLIGPRNDIEGLGIRLAEALPYYRVRYVAKPGLTGWAQVNQQYEPGNLSPQSIEETKMRLAYDFYYLKHRSFVLDVVIALKTLKRMLFRLAPA